MKQFSVLYSSSYMMVCSTDLFQQKCVFSTQTHLVEYWIVLQKISGKYNPPEAFLYQNFFNHHFFFYSVVDTLLPTIMLDAAQVVLNMIGVIGVVAYVNPILMCPIVFLAIIFIFFRRGYLRTSRCIKYLEASGKQCQKWNDVIQLMITTKFHLINS